MDTFVTIVIVNFNTENVLTDCLLSIQEQTTAVDYEVIVVDNASAEGSLDALIQLFPNVRFEFLSENLGFGIANNYGAKIAKGEYLFFLNPDTIILNNVIAIFCEYMSSHLDVAICGGNLYKNDGNPAVSYHLLDFYIREMMILFNRRWRLGFNDTQSLKEVKIIMGADIFIRKSIFDQIGGFDPDFFMYFEEVYLSDLVRKLNYRIVSIPQAKIIHLEGAAAENKDQQLAKWSYQEHWYSKWIYFNKTKGHLLTSILYLINMTKLYGAILYYSIKSNQDKLSYWSLKQQVIKKTYERYKNKIKEK